MTDANQSDARTIADALKQSEIGVIRVLSGEFAPVPRTVTRQAVASFAHRHPNLCKREWQDGCAQSTYYRLTPLGLALQDFLEGSGL